MTPQSDRNFVGFDGCPLKVIGVFTALARLGAKSANARFYVMEEGKQCLMGLETAELLKAINFNAEAVSSNYFGLDYIKQ